jgi:hypothetical protein
MRKGQKSRNYLAGGGLVRYRNQNAADVKSHSFNWLGKPPSLFYAHSPPVISYLCTCHSPLCLSLESTPTTLSSISKYTCAALTLSNISKYTCAALSRVHRLSLSLLDVPFLYFPYYVCLASLCANQPLSLQLTLFCITRALLSVLVPVSFVSCLPPPSIQ